MRLLSALVAVVSVGGALAGVLPRSAGTSETDGSGKVSLRQVRNPNFVRNGPMQLAKAYRKYGWPIPDDLKAAVQRIRANSGKRSTGSVETRPEQNDVEYLTPVSIGTPEQAFQMDIDTGSSDLWVFSTVTAQSDVGGQSIYDPSRSSTSEEMDGYTWEIAYGDGSTCSGIVYKDTVTIGGLTVKSQAVEVAEQVSDQFTGDTNNDGLLGLAFSNINTVMPSAQNTFFENAKADLDAPVFTADLRSGAPGYYNFGYIDSDAYTGNITYVPVDYEGGFWKWTTTGYAVGDGDLKNITWPGIADTGTSLLLLPDTVVSDYYAQVEGAKYDARQGAYTLPCKGDTPGFSLGLGDDGEIITVPGEYVKYAALDAAEENCFGGIQGGTGSNYAIYGDVMLKSAFVVFDDGNKQLGFASKKLTSIEDSG